MISRELYPIFEALTHLGAIFGPIHNTGTNFLPNTNLGLLDVEIILSLVKLAIRVEVCLPFIKPEMLWDVACKNWSPILDISISNFWNLSSREVQYNSNARVNRANDKFEYLTFGVLTQFDTVLIDKIANAHAGGSFASAQYPSNHDMRLCGGKSRFGPSGLQISVHFPVRSFSNAKQNQGR